MRLFSYILTALVTIFVFNVALSFSLPGYRDALVSIRSDIFAFEEKTPPEEEQKSESDRLVESLDRIDRHIESLGNRQQATGTGTEIAGGSGSVGTGSVDTLSGTSSPEEEALPKEPEIPLSWIFLAKVMPEITLKKVENAWFFGIQVMGKIAYNTYSDEARKIRVYAFNDTYDTILLNMKLTGSVYSLNETDQFFGYTFYLNPTKKDPKDTTVRFVTSLEGRAIGVEVPKSYYPILKKMFLKQ